MAGMALYSALLVDICSMVNDGSVPINRFYKAQPFGWDFRSRVNLISQKKVSLIFFRA